MKAPETFLKDRISLFCDDCLQVLPTLESNSIDSVVCDPPYHLSSIVKRFGSETAAPAKVGKTGAYARASSGFMGKKWDGGDIAFRPEVWIEVLRILKPGGHLISFGGTRTYHRMACAIEDAGFEIRDMISWLYGSGFPKSHDVSKGIDRAAGAERAVIGPGTRHNSKRCAVAHGDTERLAGGVPDITAPATKYAAQWDGFGTALKPACEPIVLARKPLIGTVAENVLKHGTGALNIDGCRVGDFENTTPPGTDRFNQANFEQGYRPGAYQNGRTGEASADRRYTDEGSTNFAATPGPRGGSPSGRWPANVIHDGSDEVLQAFPETTAPGGYPAQGAKFGYNGGDRKQRGERFTFDEGGSAARFFYCAKGDSDDRLGSKHPTVKPLDLMQYLVRLVTPPGGLVLDPFSGTGTTGEAAWREGMRAILIEREAEYQDDIRRRMKLILSGPDERAREAIKAKTKDKPVDAGPLFR